MYKRQELGLGQIAEDETEGKTEDGDSSEESENGENETSTDSQEDLSDSGDGARDALRAENGNSSVRIASADLPLVLAQTDASFTAIQAELGYLQSKLTEKTGQYDGYLNTIEEKKAAEAAEKARKEALRTSIVTNALQYVGNPYVYGGNNPNTGVDCSGFTSYVMLHGAGVSMNRSSGGQAQQGVAVSADQMRPGDLVFYGNGSRVNHVAMYIGNGQVVHASTYKTGIKLSPWNYRAPVGIRNVLGD